MATIPNSGAGNYFLILFSGTRREPLFETPADRRALNKATIAALRRFDAKLHAYCLLPNHFRALVQIEDRLLPKAMRQIASRYARYRQARFDSTGPLFERPFKAQRIVTDTDFLSALRSVHLSPVVANQVVDADDYRWSSHRAYLGYKSVTWITTDFGLSLLASDLAQARIAYNRFIVDGTQSENTSNGGDLQSSAPNELNPRDATNDPTSPPLDSSAPTQKLLRRFARNRARKSTRKFLSIY